MTVAVARPRRHAMLGVGLMAYGLAGLLILVVVAAGVLRALDRVEALSIAFEAQRRSLTTALETASSTIRSTAVTVSGIDSSLAQAQTSVSNAGRLATDVSLTMANLAGALNVTILGTQPFASASAGFTQAASELQSLATELMKTSTALGANSADTRAVGLQLVNLQTAVEAVRDGLRAAPDTRVSGTDVGSLRLVLGSLLAWLAVQALVAVFAGMGLLTRAMRRRRTEAPLVEID